MPDGLLTGWCRTGWLTGRLASGYASYHARPSIRGPSRVAACRVSGAITTRAGVSSRSIQRASASAPGPAAA